MPTTMERRLQIPQTAPQKLIDDIETYNALIALQERMQLTAPWYLRLA